MSKIYKKSNVSKGNGKTDKTPFFLNREKKKTVSKKTNKSGKKNNPNSVSKIYKKSYISTSSKKTDKNNFSFNRSTSHMKVNSDTQSRSEEKVFFFAGSELVANICSCGVMSNGFIF